jgi:hypothetical protein
LKARQVIFEFYDPGGEQALFNAFQTGVTLVAVTALHISEQQSRRLARLRQVGTKSIGFLFSRVHGLMNSRETRSVGFPVTLCRAKTKFEVQNRL